MKYRQYTILYTHGGYTQAAKDAHFGIEAYTDIKCIVVVAAHIYWTTLIIKWRWLISDHWFICPVLLGHWFCVAPTAEIVAHAVYTHGDAIWFDDRLAWSLLAAAADLPQRCVDAVRTHTHTAGRVRDSVCVFRGWWRITATHTHNVPPAVQHIPPPHKHSKAPKKTRHWKHVRLLQEKLLSISRIKSESKLNKKYCAFLWQTALLAFYCGQPKAHLCNNHAV